MKDTNLGKDDHKTFVEELITTISQRCHLIFKDRFNEIYVSIKINDHYETIRLTSTRFSNIIQSEYYEKTKDIISKEKLSSVLNLIIARADLDKNLMIRDLSIRVAKDVNKSDRSFTTSPINEQTYNYDLANTNWEIVRITTEGWKITSNSSNKPLFRRYRNNHSQDTPQRSYPQDIVKKFLSLFNFGSKNYEMLFLVYLVSLFIPEIAKPILILRGNKGSAKTTAFELIKKIVDPGDIDTLFFPKEINDLIQILNHNYLTCFDNISYVSDEMSDLLCRVTTGTGYSKRKLYTDDDTIAYKFKRPIGINGINLASVKSDFLDRCLIIELERIPKEKRRKDEDIKSEFKSLLPSILGWIFDILTKVLQYRKNNPEKITLKELPRMAEFGEHGEIISRCIGYEEHAFINAYYDNIQIQNNEVIESSLLGKMVMEFIKEKEVWEGSASELYSILTVVVEQTDQRVVRSRAWPNAPNSMVRKLNELIPTLKENGIEITYSYDNKKKSRKITIANLENISSLSSYRSNVERSQIDNESNLSNLFISEKREEENDTSNTEEQDNDWKKAKNVINIHDIADRIHEHSDIWKCKTCDHKGDKWDLLNHFPLCKNIKKSK